MGVHYCSEIGLVFLTFDQHTGISSFESSNTHYAQGLQLRIHMALELQHQFLPVWLMGVCVWAQTCETIS